MERDDVYEYSLDTHHDEAHGKIIRKKIYLVTLILAAITAVEVVMGIFLKNDGSPAWEATKSIFIAMTLVKAAYIVMVFMHMKDETHSFRNLIMIPYYIFMIDIVILLLIEGFEVGKFVALYGAF